LPIDPRRLLTFRTVAHERSFSQAARVLSLTQPSVSQQVALLETEVGLRLLERGRGGLQLTQAGAVLLEHADAIASRLQLADRQVQTLAANRREHLHLGVFPTAATSFVPSAIARLRQIDGELRIRLSEGTGDALEARLLDGELDCALGYQDTTAARREIPGTRRIDLLQETFLLGLPPTHRLAGATDPVSLASFADDDWILPSTEGFLIEACRDAGFEPRVVSTTSDPLTTRGLIARGLGVGWVASLLVGDYNGIVVRPLKEPMRRRDIYLLLPPGDRHPLSEQLADALITTARAITPAERLA
jgi:DNA-binding transcriptional LysR family regulator